jgi:hypothetical protein
MFDISNLSVWTLRGRAADGSEKWVAATSVAPYFCLDAESEDLALARAGRALRFYQAALDRLEQFNREGVKAASSFVIAKKFSARELATHD